MRATRMALDIMCAPDGRARCGAGRAAPLLPRPADKGLLAMDEYSTDRIRNVALVAHSGAGKTSLAEALYFVTGKASRLGKVEDGTTVSDYDPDEAERGMSINLAVVPCEWKKHKINVIDTPGYADFVGEVVSGLHAADTAVVLVDATAGVEVGTEIVWKLADRLERPRLVVVNRMDRENVSWRNLLEGLRAAFGNAVAPIQVPIGEGPEFKGVVDLLDGRAWMFGEEESTEADVPEDLAAEVESAREQLVDAVAATDDALLERYLDGDAIERGDLEAALRAGVTTGQIYPVVFTAATDLYGARELLDVIVTALPSPADVPAPATANGATVEASPEAEVVAQVFKTLADQFVGKISMFRVYAGTISGDAHLTDLASGNSERVSNVHFPVGKEGEPAPKVVAGEIAFVTKLDSVATGDTLAGSGDAAELPRFEMPAPLFEAAISPATSADLDKMGSALARIAEEDPTLHVHRSDRTAETILAGLGESHVQISLERVRRKFGVNLTADVPQVAYRETIQKTTNAHGRHKRQSGGHGQFGDVRMEFSPLARGAGFEFENRITGGRVPRQYIPAVEKGMVEALEHGALAGYPVVDIRAALLDGQFHTVDSSDESFRAAARLAYQDGYPQAGPVILEPILKLEIDIPDANTGDIIGDISSRRGHVLGMTPSGENGYTTVEVEVPESEVQRYATDLRSVTQGRGTFTREFVRYQEAPPNIQAKLVAEAAQRRERR